LAFAGKFQKRYARRIKPRKVNSKEHGLMYYFLIITSAKHRRSGEEQDGTT